MYTITVTSLADSGTGSLRQAIADANAYTGTDEIQIIFDPVLAGEQILQGSNLTVPANTTISLLEGMSWNMSSYDITVKGKIKAHYSTHADLFVSSSNSAVINIMQGGELDLLNANVNLSKYYCEIVVKSGGSLR